MIISGLECIGLSASSSSGELHWTSLYEEIQWPRTSLWSTKMGGFYSVQTPQKWLTCGYSMISTVNWMLTLFPKMPFKCILLLLTILVLLCRVGTFIFSPLWLDAFKINSNSTNETNTSNSLALVDGVDPYFVVLSQSMLATAVFGLALGALCVFRPVEQTYSDVERHYPKVNFAFAGFSMAISSCIVNFSLSGTRSAPFLIALFGNFIVPIQFITRFDPWVISLM